MICKNCGKVFDIKCPSCGAIQPKGISGLKVEEIMTKDVISVNMKTPVREVMRIIRERDINALPIVDDSRNLVGIVSQKDLLFRDEWFDALWSSAYESTIFTEAVLRKISSTIDRLMSKDVITVSREDSVCKAAELMVNKRKKQLPVVEGRKLVGMLSRKDIIKLIVSVDEAQS
jgi:CBS domain-containing protein